MAQARALLQRTDLELTARLRANICLGIAESHVGNADAAREVTDPVAAKSLEGIRSASRRGALVTQRLLSLGRSEPACRERVDLAELLDAVKPLLCRCSTRACRRRSRSKRPRCRCWSIAPASSLRS